MCSGCNILGQIKIGKIERMPIFTLRKEISFENQRNCI